MTCRIFDDEMEFGYLWHGYTPMGLLEFWSEYFDGRQICNLSAIKVNSFHAGNVNWQRHRLRLLLGSWMLSPVSLCCSIILPTIQPVVLDTVNAETDLVEVTGGDSPGGLTSLAVTLDFDCALSGKG